MPRRRRVSGWLEISVLSMLARRDMHGYAMIKEIEKATGGEWIPAPGSLYPTLSSLVKHGYVKARKEIAKGRTRIVYSITEKGLEYLLERAETLMSRAVPSIIGFMESQLEAIKKLGGADTERAEKMLYYIDLLCSRLSELRADIENMLSSSKGAM